MKHHSPLVRVGGVSVDRAIVGVRIADGSYVPVLDTSSKRRRRLVLTTVREGQTSVHVDLFKDVDESFENPQFLGNLAVENIAPQESGAADVTLILGTDESGSINATLTDAQTGEYQSLSASLEPAEGAPAFGDADFDLSDDELSFDDEIDLNESADDLTLDDSDLEDAGLEAVDLDDLSLDDLTLEEATSEAQDQIAGEADEADQANDADEADQANDADEALPGLEDFSEEEIGFDASLADAEIDLSMPEKSEKPEESEERVSEDEFSFEDDDLSLDGLDFGEAAGDEVALESEDETRPASPLDEAETEGMVEAELGDEDFSFDEDEFDELTEETDEEESGEQEPIGAPIIDDTISEDEFRRMDETADEAAVAPRKFNGLVFAGYLILALAALGVLTYLIFRLLEGSPAPPLTAALLPATSVQIVFRGDARGRSARRSRGTDR